MSSRYSRDPTFKRKIGRTVIGSFPRQTLSSPNSLKKAIEEVVDLQLVYGIDLITDGERVRSFIRRI